MLETFLRIDSTGVQLDINVEAHTNSVLKKFVNNEFWARFIPGLRISKLDKHQQAELNICINDSTPWHLDMDGKSVGFSPKDILHGICLSGYLLEAKRQERGFYTVHGNVIAKKDKTIALIGQISGIGKTTLSAFAAGKGWQWLSDDVFVIDEHGNFVGSTRGTLDDKKTKKSSAGLTPDNSGTRRSISMFVIPIVTPVSNNSAPIVHTYKQDKAFWHLYEEMTRNIRMTQTDMSGPSVPFPSLDSVDISVRRRQAAKNISSRTPMKFVMSGAQAILNNIESSLDLN